MFIESWLGEALTVLWATLSSRGTPCHLQKQAFTIESSIPGKGMIWVVCEIHPFNNHLIVLCTCRKFTHSSAGSLNKDSESAENLLLRQSQTAKQSLYRNN